MVSLLLKFLLLFLHLLLLCLHLVGLLLRQHLLPNQLCLDNRHLPSWLQMWLQLLTHDHHLEQEREPLVGMLKRSLLLFFVCPTQRKLREVLNRRVIGFISPRSVTWLPSLSFFMKFQASRRVIRVTSTLFTERISSPTRSTPFLSAAPPESVSVRERKIGGEKFEDRSMTIRYV